MAIKLFRLSTVRAKLLWLVATTLLMLVAALPVLSWVLGKQLVDEVDDRVEVAHKSFEIELQDDLAALALASRVIAADGDTARAIEAGDRDRADDLAERFVAAYPDIDVVIADARGTVLSHVGCRNPVRDARELPEIASALAGREARGVTASGCERVGSGAPPAYLIAVPVKQSDRVLGAVVVCLPIDTAHLINAGQKLGLELGLLRGSTLLAKTDGFPLRDIGSLQARPTLEELGERTFAVRRFDPRELQGTEVKLGVVAALDVTDVRGLVRRHLFFALGVLALAAVVSVGFGVRMASLMSRALGRIHGALAKLEQHEYTRIEMLRTGDEIEDLANGFNVMVEGLKERDELRTTFGKYMTASVVDHLLGGKVALGGETLPVTIVFSDIRSFTTISERRDAQELVGLLNEYFTEMVGAVMEANGVVDKYIGDAIMAVFGAPVPTPDDPVNAVRAAVRMRQALVVLNRKFEARGMAPLRTGIGIHTGQVVAGNIGSERRMEYTVIGDAVNLASRLESSTKELGVNVLISEDTYLLTKSHIVARKVREITVKGRAQPVMTYEVLGLVGEPALVADEREAVAPAELAHA